MGDSPILKCPLARESEFSIAIVPAYLLTSGSAQLIKGDALAIKIPEYLSNEVRRIHQLGEEQGWRPLIMLTCITKHCSRCIPGVSWSRSDPCFYMIPTDIEPGHILPDNISMAYPPGFEP